ncbi:ATP-binding cassette domain-containing protein [Alicyclobacillus sp. SO9]|uniref:ATP-binding cassette domain-containing protein n=1 Tax=Alicyclobacillus sp. SO9 TaxID=2665646 RepID=UPI0018E823A9|nr:ATP-binding cassette domain-containing protein [Alicyclobacillus sp. SO9]QQE79355.1 ATP-binding cassette domain-containing protein [Alicyclobacillus sp. SO9]
MRLEFRDIRVRNHNTHLTEPITFSVEEGSTTAILGASKTGKSTLLLYGSGNVRPVEGTVQIIDEEGQSLTPCWQLVGIGSIEHFAPLFETLTVEEHLFFHGKLHHLRGAKKRAEELLSEYSLTDVRKQRVKDIDKFSYARLSLAISIAHRPPFLLLDEPEVGLTEQEWQQMVHYFRRLERNNVGILYTTVLEAASAAATQTVALPRGEVRTTWEYSPSSELSGGGYGAIN